MRRHPVLAALVPLPRRQRHPGGALLRQCAAHPGVTDEAGAIEAAGLKPRLVRADVSNLKVTFPADLRLAELILQGRKS